MRSHRQNCDVSDITSEQIECLAARARSEGRRQRLSDGFCAAVALVAILAGWAIGAAADSRANEAPKTSVYVGMPKHAHTVDQEQWSDDQAAASALTCPSGEAQR